MAEKPSNKVTEEDESAERSNAGPSNIEVDKIEVGGDVGGSVIVGHGNVIHRITNFFQGDTKGQLEQRNRRVMLDHVENFWVRGVLEKSLHGAALLELGMKEDPGAVSYPWTVKKEATDETLPPGTSMLEIFQEIGLGRSLLILGAPGAGKTTMLLELARQLIQRAREDLTEPMPVVFNLASWQEKQSLPAWLGEQLNLVYSVPRKIAPAWVDENRMYLLLDGLDEVQGERRAKCVEAINQFRKENGLTSLVVCSRIEEYSVLTNKLSLQGAITIQPLTSKQIEAYFERFGKSLVGVKQLLRKDKTLEELTETPLMLSIIALAYKDRSADELAVSGSLERQRAHLFDTYITRMFERSTRTANPPFSKEQTLYYLHWLAKILRDHNLVTYQIEGMQPVCLKNQQQDRQYRLYIGLTLGLSGGLISGLLVGLMVRLIIGLIFGVSVGLIGWLSVWLRGAATDRIMMVDRLNWSWKEARGGLRMGLIIGLPIGLLMGLLGWALGGPTWGLIYGLMGGLPIGVILGLIGGLTSKQVEGTTYPGQRLKQTLVSSLFSTLIVALIIGLSFGLFIGLSVGPSVGLSVGLSFGLMFGLSVGLRGGYLALIQHYALRLVLVQNHFLPRHLIPFLEYATSLIFLRRVGGSYIFVHRLLMEHFAEMEV